MPMTYPTVRPRRPKLNRGRDPKFVRCFSEQSGKLLFRQTRFANQCPQCPFCQLPMIRHGESARLWMTQNDMAAGLMVRLVTKLLKARTHLGRSIRAAGSCWNLDDLLANGGDTGSPCFLRLARYPVMASLTLASASARVLPCKMQPGSAGHSATNRPSSSSSITTRYFMRTT
jgi:hypothetical protein